MNGLAYIEIALKGCLCRSWGAALTSEVCLLNRFAAVLAADSATTVSRWDPDTSQHIVRYFKGTNKVFQLSAHHPVGLMIYENIAIHGVPWEILIKEFRATLKGTAHSSPKAYAHAFFDFLREKDWLFPVDGLEQHTRSQAMFAILGLFWTENFNIQNDNENVEKIAALRAAFAARRGDIDQLPLPAAFLPDDLAAAVRDYAVEIGQKISPWAGLLEIDPTEFAAFGIETVIKTYKESLQSYLTGIVVAGFGERELFPSFCEFRCYGFFCGKLLVDEEAKAQISSDSIAAVKAFAQTSMVDTFEMGVSFDIYSSATKLFRAAAVDLRAKIAEETGHADVLNTDGVLETVLDDLENKWLENARKTHRAPLHQVIGSLSINEMADLAETLISLQSLKEKVTKPSESVGGPVDVAVISRSEGLIWVKRKHYFDGNLNPRYFMRQKELYD